MSCPNCGCSNYQPKTQIHMFRGQPIDDMDESHKDDAVVYLITNLERVYTDHPLSNRPSSIYEDFLLYCQLDGVRKQKVVDANREMLDKYGNR